MSQPESLAQQMRHNPWFAHDANGDPITRERSCECGVRFTQRLLSERFFRVIQNQGKRCLELFEKQIPQGYVPVHCPKCERRDIGHQARVDGIRSIPDTYVEKHEAAD